MTAEPVEPLFHLLTVPTNNTAVIDGESRVWDDKFLVDADDTPETLTLRTGTCRGVEGKHLVAGFFEHDTIGFKTCREVVADVGGREHQTEFTMTLEKSRLCRIHQTGDGILRIVDTQAVNDEIDTLGIGISRQFCKIIVDAYKVVVNEDTGITFEDIGLQLLLECAPLMQMNRRHHDETRSLRVFQHLLYDIFGGVFLHLLTADGGIRAPYARVKQSEILIYLRRGAYRTARIARYHLLLDGDGWRDATYKVALGLVHSAQELSGIARERLHITALALGIQRVEGQRRFAGATDSGNYYELVSGYLDINTLQIVDSRPLYFNTIAQRVYLFTFFTFTEYS